MVSYAEFLKFLEQIDHQGLLDGLWFAHNRVFHERIQQLNEISPLNFINFDFFFYLQLEGLFFLLMQGDKFIALWKNWSLFTTDGIFNLLVLLLSNIPQLLQLLLPLLNTTHARNLHCLQLVHFISHGCQFILQAVFYPLSFLLDGYYFMVSMIAVDDALGTYQTIVTVFADIDDAVFGMVIAGSL